MADDTLSPQEEHDQIKGSMESIEDEALPILEDISIHTRKARLAISDNGEPTDTLTLSNEIVELSILNQRLSDRISMMGYTLRSATNLYERVRENHKVRLATGYEEEYQETVDVKHPDGPDTQELVTKKRVVPSVAAGVADSMKHELSKQFFELYNQCEYRMSQYKGAYRSLDKTIDTLRSKISYEKSNEHNA